MASSTNLVCIFFLLFTLLSSLQIHARDHHFFSKVSRDSNDDDTINPNHNYYNTQQNVATPFSKQEQQQEQEPNFIPQTTHTNYGLYDHETGLDDNNNYENFENEQLEGLSETSYTNNYNNNNNNYGGVEKQGMSDTRYLEGGKYFHDISGEKEFYPTNNNDFSYNKYNNNNGQFYGNNKNYYNGNGMQQGYQTKFEYDDQP